ncbi:PREDICTED: uncharacterized protein LOC101309356 [Fragaria vesca subsp. vesca]|uniref:uncharacterized protein LOC101310415 n=1 Tax=Fragaria vesca subsp. vesca TaxID=101020 RepID=UPI0002C359DF|nr:PREDICTED: uncharacterized protein LOC101310415 [Fragaria vesca subsp. vesca]
MAATATPTPENDEKTLQEELSLPILLADRVLKSAHEAESSKPECSDLAQQVDRLSHMLRSAVRICAASPSLYERPVRRIASDVTKNLDRALTLVRKCRHSGVLRQVFSITTAADFRKVSNLLESSIGDMKWLLSVFESDGANLSLPPIASNDPILSWVWSYIATIQMGQLRDRVEAASSLVSLARDNDRNKKIIVDEGGVTPLLKLLKEGSSPEAQVAAANALFHLATDRERVRIVIDLNGIPMIVSVLGDSPMRVQAAVVRLVAEMAELDPIAQEEFARENVTRPLVSLLAMDTVLDEPKLQIGKPSIHSLVISKELVGKGANSSSRLGSFSSNHYSSDGSSRGGLHYRKEKEREVESAEVKLKLKVGCAEALWKLCRDCLLNSRKVTETKGLICLAKIVEKEVGELQLNCLMTVMEIAAVAESNPELRRSAFKPNSPAAKAVVDQLMRVIQEESNPDLQLPAIKAIGSLARTFAARETRIVGPLVARLGNENVDVATEAAIALGKFVCLENFNRVEHSKTIIEFDGVPSLMRLLRSTDRINEVAHMHCLVLLCYLTLHVGNSKALEQAQVLSTLEGGARSAVAQNPDLKELFFRAMQHLSLYQPGAHPHRQTYMP